MNANFAMDASFHPCKLESLLEKKLAAFISLLYVVCLLYKYHPCNSNQTVNVTQ